MHKHRNASRQDAGGRAWGKRNSGGLALKKWFSESATVPAMDWMHRVLFYTINVRYCAQRQTRYLMKKEHAPGTGTVDATYFEEWVEKRLGPVLGRYHHGVVSLLGQLLSWKMPQPTHMSQRVADIIRETGAYAYLLYTDLNMVLI